MSRCFSRRVFSIAGNPSPFFSIRSVYVEEGATCDDGTTPPRRAVSAVSSLPPFSAFFLPFFLQHSAHHRHFLPPIQDQGWDDIMSLFHLKTKEMCNSSDSVKPISEPETASLPHLLYCKLVTFAMVILNYHRSIVLSAIQAFLQRF